jgi:6-phosphogluconolactonase
MKTSIEIFKDVEELSDFFGQKLVRGVQAKPEGHFLSVALSGGSTPRKVFEYLALHFKNSIDWQRVLVFWSDERCVRPESDESNYRMATESLLSHVPLPAEQIFRIWGESDPSSEAKRYADVIREHVPVFENIPQFDFVMLGLGDDGHTVSVFPDNLALFNSKNLCEVAVHPLTKQRRITFAGNIINQALTAAFFVTGESKAEMVARIIEQKEGWEKLPASMVHPEIGELLWLLDEKAALNLKNQNKHR